MGAARLEIVDPLGRRTVPITGDRFTIGRRSEHDLSLARADISRDHAEIVREDGGGYRLRDRGSRYGTFVNGARIDARGLESGDVLRFGQAEGIEAVFLVEASSPADDRTATAVADLHQVTLLLEGLRALGSGGVLDEVLALVLDSAIEMGGAERGFIMLADESGRLEFKLARGRGKVTLPGRTFETSRKIPETVYQCGETRAVTDLLDGDLPAAHTGTVALGIRHVFCAPLRHARYVDAGATASVGRSIGVLYLDSRSRGALHTPAARGGLEALASEAALAIESARLYREAAEKARLEQELRVAARIQQALLPPSRWDGGYFAAMGTTVPCREIGGDCYEYQTLASGEAAFVVADVSGKGAPAALLTAVIQGALAAQTLMPGGPADAMRRTNAVLAHRALESKFATMVYAVLAPDGRLTYSNAGHNPPFVVGRRGVARLEVGGTILGLFEQADYDQDTVALAPGDLVVLFSDGVSEALSADGEEFGDARIQALLEPLAGAPPEQVNDALLAAVGDFTRGADPHDDMTVLVVRYTG